MIKSNFQIESKEIISWISQTSKNDVFRFERAIRLEKNKKKKARKKQREAERAIAIKSLMTRIAEKTKDVLTEEEHRFMVTIMEGKLTREEAFQKEVKWEFKEESNQTIEN